MTDPSPHPNKLIDNNEWMQGAPADCAERRES